MPPTTIRLGLRELPLRFEQSVGWTAQPAHGLNPVVDVINAIARGNPSRIGLEPTEIAGVRLIPKDSTLIEFAHEGESCIVSRRDVLHALEQLMEARGGHAINWILRPDPVFWRPSSLDRFDAADLEKHLVELDARIAAGTPEVELRATRQWLMPELERRGIFERLAAEERAEILDELDAPTLAAYVRAAIQVHHYFESENRAKVFKQRPDRILGSRVSLDWFRRPSPIPEGWLPVKWLTLCEYNLSQAAGEPQAVLFPEGGKLYRLEWQCDDGRTPAVLRASPN